MNREKERAYNGIIAVLEWEVNELERIATELELAWERAKVHRAAIMQGKNTFFECWMFDGAYERCLELLDRFHVLEQDMEETEKSRAYILTHME